MSYLGDFPVGGKVSFLWNTHAIAGESITRATDGTLKIFKSNATAATWATERSSLAGVTQLEDFDATGMHSVYIDLSDNTDAGFYAAANEYQVAIVGAVVDGKTVNVPLAAFSIERAGGVAAILARLGVPAGASLADDIAVIEGHTDDIGAAGAGLTAVPWNAAWDAEVQSEVEDGIVVHRLDELLNADSDIDGATPPTVGSVFHELMTKTALSFTYDQATDSLEAVRDRGDAAWITASGFSTHAAADVWSVATRLLTAGTNIALAKGTGVTGFNDLDAAGVRSAVGLAAADLDAQLGALPTAAEGADAVWDEATAGHVTAGTFGEQLKTDVDAILVDTGTTLDARLPAALVSGRMDSHMGSAADAVLTAAKFAAGAFDAVWSVATRLLTAGTNIVLAKGIGITGFNDPSAAAISDAVWDEAIADHAGVGSTGEALSAAGSAGDPWATALPGVYGAGTAGKIIGDNINATMSSRASQTSMDDVPTSAELATALGTADDAVLAQVALVKAKTDLIPAAPAAVGDIPTAIDNADALLNRDMATGVDSGSSSVRTVRQALRLNRNKFAIAAGTLTVFKEDDATASWTAAVDTDAAANPIISSDPAGP